MGSQIDYEQLPFMKTNPKCIFFTDFDGTITLQDTNDYMTDNLGYGVERRRQLNSDILDEKLTFRDGFRDMLDSVKTPFNKCKEILRTNIGIDPYFRDFYMWARENNIPVVVLSSGMTPIIRTLLVHLVGPEANDIPIISNEVVPRPGKSIDEEGGWTIQYHDDSGFGHDKSLAIRPYANLPKDIRPTLMYAGDGVSDMSAAAETDLLFAKKGRDLITYAQRQGVPFTIFEDWKIILETTQDVLAGKKSIAKVADEGVQDFKSGAAGVKPTTK